MYYKITESNQLIREIKQLCKKSLSAYKVPNQIYFWDSIPKTPSNKLLRRKVRELINNQSSRQPGEVDNITNDFFDIACSVGFLRVYKVQMEGKKMMPAKDFILGMPTLKGSRFS